MAHFWLVVSVMLGATALLARTGGLVAAIPPGPIAQRLIVDTDMGFDVDDAVAVCLANSLHMNGKVPPHTLTPHTPTPRQSRPSGV
eukprot:SAG11_NODE_74_length_18043_cov_13.387818_5_plen_86_part_00